MRAVRHAEQHRRARRARIEDFAVAALHLELGNIAVTGLIEAFEQFFPGFHKVSFVQVQKSDRAAGHFLDGVAEDEEAAGLPTVIFGGKVLFPGAHH